MNMITKLNQLKSKKGFTLIEMLVVIAIIAILVAIIIPTVTSATGKSKAATDAANLRSAKAVVTVGILDGTYQITSDNKVINASTKTVVTAADLGISGTSKYDSDYDEFVLTAVKNTDGSGASSITIGYSNGTTTRTIDDFATLAGNVSGETSTAAAGD